MSKKAELIAAIRAEYAKIAKIDQDAATIYDGVNDQLSFHTADPIGLSSTHVDAVKIRHLAKCYSERYESIAILLDQLDKEQQELHQGYRRGTRS